MAQQQADALALLAEAALDHGLDPGAPGERYQVVVHVDASSLADPEQPGQSVLEDGPRVSAETSRRLACDASRVVMRHDEDGRTVEVGARPRFRRHRARSTIVTKAVASRGAASIPSSEQATPVSPMWSLGLFTSGLSRFVCHDGNRSSRNTCSSSVTYSWIVWRVSSKGAARSAMLTSRAVWAAARASSFGSMSSGWMRVRSRTSRWICVST